MRKLINKNAFTIIELIVVIAILGILILLGMNNFVGNVEKANQAKMMVATKTIEDASAMYHMDNDDWPRLSNDAYTSTQLEAFATKFYDNTGKEIVLDPNGNYYDIDYEKLAPYAKAPENKEDYILQNPVGKVFYMENLNEAGKDRVDYIANKQTNTSIPSVPVLSEINDSTAKVTGEPKTEVKLNDGEWFSTPYTFTNLNKNTEYTVYIRFKATDSRLPGPLSEGIKFTTLKGAKLEVPSAPQLSNLNENSVTVIGGEGVEVKIGNGEWFNSPHSFTGLTESTDYIAYARYKETNTHNASEASIGANFTTESGELYNFTTHTFTNAGQNGRTGPSQAQLNSAYNGSVVKNYVTTTNGIQIWTVPKDGIYRIEAYGAQGGYSQNGRGLGAIIKGDIRLEVGQKLMIAVGQAGQDISGDYDSGGGGGTFVTRIVNNSTYKMATGEFIEPLIIAGGAGGDASDGSGAHGSTTEHGTGKFPNTNVGHGGVYTSDFGGPGGGGLISNGYETQVNSAGRSFLNGAQGGQGNHSYGGFGGGAGGMDEKGSGGGGYTGGTAADNHQSGNGGGGSYNSGANKSNTTGNNGHGKAIITYIGK